jgi:MFS family permease
LRAVRSGTVDAATLAAILEPKTNLVVERQLRDGQFESERGPFTRYRREVEVLARHENGADLRQTVEFSLAIPYWGWLFRWPMGRSLARLGGSTRRPWWAPPDVFDQRSAVVLGCLAALSYVTGLTGVLLSQTLTFAADQFGSGTRAQGFATAFARFDVIVALLLVAAADKRGRRVIVLLSAVMACSMTVLGALSPNIQFFAGTQLVARGSATALAIALGILAAEEVPAGSRAYAVSILSVSAAFGAGLPVAGLFVADLHPGGWRVLFALAGIGIPLAMSVARRLPESKRFDTPHVEARVAGHGRRFWLLAVSALLLALFIAPASQFTNEFLREERNYSAGAISLFTILTNVPGGIGIVVGGYLADVRGRRLVGAIGVAGGVGATVAMFFSAGWGLWAWSVIGAVVGSVTVPALGVYGPELFPTSLRGRANGIIGGLGRIGSVIGLVSIGFLAAELGGLGPGLLVLSAGPALVALLVLLAYPETARLELEDLNPEDRASP